MASILPIASFAAALIAFAYGAVLLWSISKKPLPGKRIFDAAGGIEKAIRAQFSRDFSALSIAPLIIFVILLYLLGWKAGLAFMIGAITAILGSYVVKIYTAKSYSKILEEARKEQLAGTNLAIRAGIPAALITSGLALAASLAIYSIFKDSSLLYAAALGSLVIAVTSKLISPDRENSDSAGSFTAGLIIISLAGGVTGANLAYADSVNIAYLPFAIVASALIVSIIGSWFLRTKNTKNSLLKPIVISYTVASVLLLAIEYLIIRYLTLEINLYLALAIGVIAPILFGISEYLIVRSKLNEGNKSLISRLVLIVIIAASVLGTYYFASYFGIAIVAASLSLAIIANLLASSVGSITKSISTIGLEAGLPVEARIPEERTYENIFKAMPVLISALVAVTAYFTLSGQAAIDFSLGLNDPYLIVGLIMGGLMAFGGHLISSNALKQGIIIPISILIALPVILGIFLGIPFSIGLVAGALVSSLVFDLRDDGAILTMPMVLSSALILFFGIINRTYSLRSKLIIGISLIVAILIYIFIIRLTKKEAR